MCLYSFMYNMELLIKIVIVLLACASLDANNLADKCSSVDAESNKSYIESYEEKLKGNYNRINILEQDISDNMKVLNSSKSKNAIRILNDASYFTNTMRSTILKTHPTLCLPYGQLTGGHVINIASRPLQVFCDGETAGPGWIVIQRRTNDSINFNRTISEYENGFGSPKGSFFIGLQNLHQLTSIEQHELYITLENLYEETCIAAYNNFTIANKKNNFKLESLGQYSGNASDAFTSSTGKSFNIYKDTYGSMSNVGWWMEDMEEMISNLNAHPIQWRRNTNKNENWFAAKMMIRPLMNNAPKCTP